MIPTPTPTLTSTRGVSETPAREASQLRVAILEDHAGYREDLGRLLESADGFVPAGAYGTAAEALRGLCVEPAHLVLVDLDLPEVPGEEFLRRLRVLGLDTRPVVLTAFDNPARVTACLAAGAFGYLLKHTPPEQILDGLRAAHSGGMVMSAAVALQVRGIFQAQGNIEKQLGAHLFGILSRLASGHLIDEIAEELGIESGSVRCDLSRIYKALHVKNSTQAVALFHGSLRRPL